MIHVQTAAKMHLTHLQVACGHISLLNQSKNTLSLKRTFVVGQERMSATTLQPTALKSLKHMKVRAHSHLRCLVRFKRTLVQFH